MTQLNQQLKREDKMETTHTEVKQESPSTEDVQTQTINEDVKSEQIPYARFKKEIARGKELQSQLEGLQAQISDANEQKLISEGKKDEVITTQKEKIAQLTETAEIGLKFMQEEKDRWLDKIPEEKRELWSKADLSLIREYVEDRESIKKVSVDNSMGGMTNTSFKDKKASDMVKDGKSDPAQWKAFLSNFKS